MKRRIATALVFLAALAPSTAMAAEEAEGQGSWLGLLFFVINFLLFAFVVVYFAGPPLRRFFSDRAATIHSNLAKSAKAFEEAETLARAAAERTAALESEVTQLKRELEEETAFQLKRISELARSNSDRIRRDTEMTAAAQVENAQRRVRQNLAAAAAQLARELIARHFEAADQNRLLDGFMNRLGQEVQR
jgi:F0F1-type ATP synthase membrane subunit b/b'